ncbi:LEPR-XLL domain-containing protein [Thiomonas sp.]|uniref:LEPR-XLL domain-containing protein n=1 Tax=Thiomonas sp. TaxID=2047785 RepID=UPI00338D3EC6
MGRFAAAQVHEFAVLTEQLERRLLLAAALGVEIVEQRVQPGFQRGLRGGVETIRLIDEPGERAFRSQGQACRGEVAEQVDGSGGLVYLVARLQQVARRGLGFVGFAQEAQLQMLAHRRLGGQQVVAHLFDDPGQGPGVRLQW